MPPEDRQELERYEPVAIKVFTGRGPYAECRRFTEIASGSVKTDVRSVGIPQLSDRDLSLNEVLTASGIPRLDAIEHQLADADE